MKRIQTDRGFLKPLSPFKSLVLVIAVTFSGCGVSSVSTPVTEKEPVTQAMTKASPDNTTLHEENKPINPSKSYLPKDPLFDKEWHLLNSQGIDINITNVWKKYRGRGVKIAVVDTGIEAQHPDLKANVDLNLSFCYENNRSDPSPTQRELSDPFIDVTHGTAVSGIIAASQNSIGVSGVAPEASLVGLNVFSNPTDSVFENAMLYKGVDISSNSWGNELDMGLDDDRIVLDAIIRKMQTDPIIYVFASGNEHANSNFSSVLNSRYTFAVGAVTRDGRIAEYSNYGANLLTVAPGGSGVYGEPKIVTTDLTGAAYGYDSYKGEHFDLPSNTNFDYTDQMNGTSAAAPIVSGIIALMLEANPSLTYRDVRDIIIKTAVKTDPADVSWQKNGAGIFFSPRYGFGLINAGKAVAMAEHYPPLSKELHLTQEKSLNIPIPDNDDQGIDVSFDIPDNIATEYVEVTLNSDHTYSGDLKITLVSPDGTKSILAYGNTITDDMYLPWTFTSLQFYAESSKGLWHLHVADVVAKNSGILHSAKITLYGHAK